jgi:putative endonuclease
MQYTVYILFSVIKGRYYVGYTGADICERIRKHNTNHAGFTGKTGDWKLVYSEPFAEKMEAMKREKEIKSWKSSKKIASLVGLKHPDL